jgi:hypothetical protein
VGERAADVVPRVTAALGEEPEREDLGSLETYFYPRRWVEVYVRFGRVESVNFGVVYDEADQPQWPSVEPSASADPARDVASPDS